MARQVSNSTMSRCVPASKECVGANRDCVAKKSGCPGKNSDRAPDNGGCIAAFCGCVLENSNANMTPGDADLLAIEAVQAVRTTQN